ncbi:hypothetical protein HAP32_03643 [Serratia fonticola]|nr:hypothetical protein HAP32_03643 [Serratia fonticola]RDL26856.1 hypothetical protein DFO62_103269 [Serratia fonticola]
MREWLTLLFLVSTLAILSAFLFFNMVWFN